ncbi:DUF6456 domain-containing protein [Allosphingosinicella vermicomposti]|uniref:DUF6456 domain-containing protein n=1 Tax=Allosphingosinicella vermicomposti TaxID=614671 RepID=UPI001FDF465F|nr:DUF6456 domain-containing protein [Allosphingosinicella vermicomposti]
MVQTMAKSGSRILVERPLPTQGDVKATGKKRARSVTVNLAESPLGWLKARGLITDRQFDAGEQLRVDWERAQLGPRVTMCWDAAAAPSRTARGAPAANDPLIHQLSARDRFDAAVAAAGPGLSDILWRIVCAGEGMRDAEQALGWPARAGKLVLTLALDRLADHYRLR